MIIQPAASTNCWLKLLMQGAPTAELDGATNGRGMALFAEAAWAVALGRRIILPIDALTMKARDVTLSGGTLKGVPSLDVTAFEALRRSIAEAEAALHWGEVHFARASMSPRPALGGRIWPPAS
ncbi:hypothetical protein [Roseomonas harenae]|uniref:hypothetical protein n=1 Tax=Muricoccus harenae TaxID=2692566 RepID=UPI0013312632|nr:hypothetical protein [Roseomonas harenae]